MEQEFLEILNEHGITKEQAAKEMGYTKGSLNTILSRKGRKIPIQSMLFGYRLGKK